MAKILEIKKYPDSILQTKCSPVEIIDDKIRELVADMLFTMHADKGIGLAASQVGINKRLAVVDVGEGPLCLINPEIIEKEGQDSIEEGCLSLPDVLLNVKRAKHIKVKALNSDAKEMIIDAKGLLATVIQHEMDHINGVLIIDHAGFIKKNILKRKLLKQHRAKNM